MIEKLTIAFIGAGHLGSALARGLIKSGCSANKIMVSNRSPEKLTALVETLGISAMATNTAAVDVADVVFLAVKPQFIKGVCQEIGPAIIKKRPLIISLAGVIRLDDISLSLGVDRLGIVRAMTNTPTAFCKGTTALFANPFLMPSQTDLTKAIFQALGTSFWVEKEAMLDILTAPVGCAPAYVFLFLEALQEAAISRGIAPHLAREIALNAVIGAAELAKQSGDSFSTLREKVTTPDGITASSLKKISTPTFFNSFKQVHEAAEKRIEEIDLSIRSRLK